MACTRQGDRSPSGPPRSHSTPLNSCGGFDGDTVDDRTDFASLIGDAARYFVEKVIRELGEAGGEAVDAPDCPECHGAAQPCAVALAFGVMRCGERGSRLPDRLIQISHAQLFYINTVYRTRYLQALGGNFPLNAHDQPRAREGMTHEQIFGDADITTDAAGGIFDLIFEGGGLWDGKAALHIVMDFYLRDARTRRMSVAAFAYVGIQRSLCDEIRAEIFYFFLQHFFVDTAHCEPLLTHRGLALECF